MLIISFIMLKNCQIYLKNQVVFSSQDFKSMFDYFSTLRRKVLNYKFQEYFKEVVSIILCKALTLVETL